MTVGVKERMKNRFRKLYVIVIGGIILFNFSGCFSKPVRDITPQGMTPNETVEFYFKQWNDKNISAMDSVVRDEMKDIDYGLSTLVYVNLTKSVEETEKHMNLEEQYLSDTFPGYIDYSVLEVEFEVEYKQSLFFDDTGGFPNGKSVVDNWRFILGKIYEDSDWIILSWGV